ncbi:hypothetical protein QQS21_004044 [Conoideocrella luteorostrata]|uniref:peptide chain release factor N(5)-glutamine methyltransferase n=1 Tax=Conoideocrella luteorostrata TaxID=1105319 RepID=A0AAJ0FV11_9HYPO|nr:hypothetical protein QQS21_004044 [Conoideocrella luteorostrata]
MPRLLPRLLTQARQQSNNLAALLLACRDIQSAKNELRWLTEFVNDSVPQSKIESRRLLASLCQRRGRGVPLQYILGSQPFGPLDIKCRPGVLIPRPETEAYTYHLVDLIKSDRTLRGNNKVLRVFDFCTGSGCIALLLYALLGPSFRNIHVEGVDVSSDAVELARHNINHNVGLENIPPSHPGQTLSVLEGNIFNDEIIAALANSACDILISNPPYISQGVWDFGRGQLGYSVRKYEPRLALVPNQELPAPTGWQRQDAFYSRLLDISLLLQPSMSLFELGDESQARRVLAGLFCHDVADHAEVEVWRDWPDLSPANGEKNTLTISLEKGSRSVAVKGSGQIRSMFVRFQWDK